MPYVITDASGRVVTTVPDSVSAHRATRRAGNVGAKVERARVCSRCGSLGGPGPRELRPYGKGGALVCFECANKSPKSRAAARRQFGRRLDSAGPVAVLTRDGPKPLKVG
jgi:hypothetical protein